jgi:hypothetical protein
MSLVLCYSRDLPPFILYTNIRSTLRVLKLALIPVTSLIRQETTR